MSYIEIKNITKRFSDKLVLDNVSFSVEQGSIFGLIGPNGAGKSTLINIMTGLWDANGGEVKIGGFDSKKDPLEMKALIGVVPQEIALMELASAYDNLEFFGTLYGLKGKMLKERINEALELTGLTNKKKEIIKKYSGGMKRRINIAAAIMHHPKVLIMDEPTVGIDPQSRNHIFEFAQKLNKENNTTIIYTSHYMEEVEHLCDKLFIMDNGREVASGSKETIKAMVSDSSKLLLRLGAYDKQLLIELGRLRGINDSCEEDNVIKLQLDKDIFKLQELVALLEEHKVNIASISFEEPSLEEAFLKLTGKKLRD